MYRLQMHNISANFADALSPRPRAVVGDQLLLRRALVGRDVLQVDPDPIPDRTRPAHAVDQHIGGPQQSRGAGIPVEGLGIVFLEASAAGVPVIAGNSGGAPETVQHNKTGLVVDGRSVDRVADAVAELLIDRDRAVAMGAAGREWVTAQWRWDTLAAKLADFLRGDDAAR